MAGEILRISLAALLDAALLMAPVGAGWLANSVGLPPTVPFASQLAPTSERTSGYALFLKHSGVE
jgi:hypothetical protein